MLRKIILLVLVFALVVPCAYAKKPTPHTVMRVSDLDLCPVGRSCVDGSGNMKMGSATMGSSSLTAIQISALPATAVKGATYLVDDAADASDCTVGGADPGVTHECMWNGTAFVAKNAGAGATGAKGWSPVIAIVSDGDRRIQEVTDWTGGEGDKPTALGYIGATGLVALAADAIDIRGTVWITGFDTPAAESEVCAAGEHKYFLDTSSENKLFECTSATWTQIGAIRGATGATGAAGSNGASSYTYIAYASDNAGTGFSTTPSSTLKYRAEIVSATVIASPSASDFSAATWVQFIGDDGADGAGFSSCTPGDGDCGIEVEPNSLAVASWPAPTTATDASIRPDSNGTWYYYDLSATPPAWTPIGTGSGLPAGCTGDDILVADAAEATGWKCIGLEEHPQFVTLLSAFNAAGLNSFTFTPETPAAYPYYSQSGTFNADFEVTDSSTTYTIAGVRYDIGSGYDGNSLTDQTGGIWRAAFSGLSAGSYTLQLEATDSKSTPNTGESSEYTFTVDLTAPVLVAGADDTFDGTGSVQGTVVLTETNYQAPTYTLSGGVTGSGTCVGTYPNYTTPSIDLTGIEADVTITYAATDLSGRTATGSDLVQVFEYSGGSANNIYDAQVRFAEGTTAEQFTVALYNSSNELIAYTATGVASAGIVTVLFTTNPALVDGTGYIRAIVAGAYGIDIGITTSGSNLYRDPAGAIGTPPSTLSTYWVASNKNLDISIRNSAGTVLLGQTSGSGTHTDLDYVDTFATDAQEY